MASKKINLIINSIISTRKLDRIPIYKVYTSRKLKYENENSFEKF